MRLNLYPYAFSRGWEVSDFIHRDNKWLFAKELYNYLLGQGYSESFRHCLKFRSDMSKMEFVFFSELEGRELRALVDKVKICVRNIGTIYNDCVSFENIEEKNYAIGNRLFIRFQFKEVEEFSHYPIR